MLQLLMIGRAGRWNLNPMSATPLQPKQIRCSFLDYASTSDDWQGWLMNSNPVCHPSPAKKIKCLFLDYASTSDDWQVLVLIDLNPICHPSPAKKIKCSFLDYVQLLMIGRAGLDRLEPHLPPLSSQKNKMLIFGLRFNF